MPKTIKKMYYKCLTFEKLIEASERSALHKTRRRDVILFSMDLETNISKMLIELKDGSYKMGKYREFVIYEPKERIIKSLPYRDRIVHQWYVEEFVKPYIVPKFICDSYACIKDKGTHKSKDKVIKYMRRKRRENPDYYVLKCDIKKFFYSIDKHILYEIMKKHISDKKILELTYKLIYDDGADVGIPIGNYTSQFFANIYLNELDKYVKETLRYKYYVRYMDDFILLIDSKEEAREVFKKLEKFVNEKLNLEFNDKSRYYPNKMGVNFCGYRIFNTHVLLRDSFKKRINKRVKVWNKLYRENRLNYKKRLLSYNSFIGHANHANSLTFKLKTLDNILDNHDLKIK